MVAAKRVLRSTEVVELTLRGVLVGLLCLLNSYLRPFVREVQERDWPLYNFPYDPVGRVPHLAPWELGAYCCLVAVLGLQNILYLWPRRHSRHASDDGNAEEAEGFLHATASESIAKLEKDPKAWKAFFRPQLGLLWGITLALLLTGIVVTLTKNLIGRPRPDFLSRCQVAGFDRESPDFTMIGLIPECTNPNERVVRKGRLSFPSGHSAYSSCVCMFGALLFFFSVPSLVIWPSVRFVLAVLFMLPAVYCGISRSMDYRHHWEDIVAGSVLGVFFAAASFYLYKRDLCSDIARPSGTTKRPLSNTAEHSPV